MNSVQVLDSKMSYWDEGEGTPFVFLHGNPTSSYLWRKILPKMAGGRFLAPDLIGMGESGQSSSGYRFVDHVRYLDAWFDVLGLDEVVLVGHDWGGALAFDWARRHPARVRGIAFMETFVRPMSWTDFSGPSKDFFMSIRTPLSGEELVLERNIFIDQALPFGVASGLSPEDHEHYRKPYLTPQSRLPLLQWPREIPLDGEPADVAARFEAYGDWLSKSSTVPKLLLSFDPSPGSMTTPEVVEWCRTHFDGLEIEPCGPAGHHAPEDQPEAIARAINAWAGRHNFQSSPRVASTKAGEKRQR